MPGFQACAADPGFSRSSENPHSEQDLITACQDFSIATLQLALKIWEILQACLSSVSRGLFLCKPFAPPKPDSSLTPCLPCMSRSLSQRASYALDLLPSPLSGFRIRCCPIDLERFSDRISAFIAANPSRTPFSAPIVWQQVERRGRILGFASLQYSYRLQTSSFLI